jgi:hypothetical protein
MGINIELGTWKATLILGDPTKDNSGEHILDG